jgi:hypothetical protein
MRQTKLCHEGIYSLELLFGCSTAICEIILWRWLSKRHRHAWNCFALMMFAVVFHIYVEMITAITGTLKIWQSMPTRFFSYLISQPPWESILWISLIPGLIGLWLSRREYATRGKDLWQILASISAASFIVYIKGSPGSLDWAQPVPYHLDVIISSGFGYFDCISILCLSSYLIIQVGLRVFKPQPGER